MRPGVTVFLQNTLILWDVVPGVQTLGVYPAKQTRVLKERRIAAGLGTAF